MADLAYAIEIALNKFKNNRLLRHFHLLSKDIEFLEPCYRTAALPRFVWKHSRSHEWLAARDSIGRRNRIALSPKFRNDTI